MSGSSGGYMPVIASSINTDCSNLSFVTSLTSPVASVVVTLKIGDILYVELVQPSSLQVFDSNGVLVGSLLTAHRDAMISCIHKGFEFVATINRINGGSCDVRVKSK